MEQGKKDTHSWTDNDDGHRRGARRIVSGFFKKLTDLQINDTGDSDTNESFSDHSVCFEGYNKECAIQIKIVYLNIILGIYVSIYQVLTPNMYVIIKQ